MKFKNYARFKRKNIKQKQEIYCTDVYILFGLSYFKTFSGLKEYLRREINFCDQAGREKKKVALQKDLQELEVYSANEL